MNVFKFLVEFVLLGLHPPQLFRNDFACFVSLDVEPLEVEDDTADIIFEILTHFFLTAEGHLVLVHLLNQLFLSLARQIMNVALDLLNSSGNFNLQISIFRFQFHNLRLQIRYLVSIVDLLQVEVLDGPDLVQILLQGLHLLLEVLVGGVEQ